MGRTVRVYAIYNPFEWNKYAVQKECREDEIELKVHESYFEDNWFDDMRKANEVWLFGNCKFIPAAMIAKAMMMDCWQMG